MTTQRSTHKLALIALALIFALVLLMARTAYADNGPHGDYTATTDACAGCHRAHTAAAGSLLRTDVPALCTSCHGPGGNGADTNVMDGLYLERDLNAEIPVEGNVLIGSLKAGGFINALMDTDTDTGTPAISSPATSSHLYGVGAITGTAWGNGAISAADDPGVTYFSLTCVSCHDPHGGASTIGDPTYRLLRAIPSGSEAGEGVDITDPTGKTYTVADEGNNYMGEDYTVASSLASWCSQCHTRYLAPGGSGHTDSGDSIFTFRHETAATTSCVSCHVAHGTSATMIGYAASVEWPDSTTTPGGDARSSLLRLDNRGVCAYCHLKPDGSIVGGSCTGCHSAAQGTRRAVTGEFPSDVHAHYGTELDENSCQVCHDQATHMDGYVDLYDPDGASGPTSGAGYRFQQASELTSDPDLSNFCASCHDADGYTRGSAPLEPFGDGTNPADVNSKFQGTLQWEEWYGGASCFANEGTLRAVNSHHDISDTDQTWSGANLECLNCHGAHTASRSQPVSDPSDTTAAWSGTDNEFCLTCHNGGTGPNDPGFPQGVTGPTIPMRGLNMSDDTCSLYNVSPWWVDYTWTHSPHGLDSKRGWSGYSGAPGDGPNGMECMDCHDPHGSYTLTNTPGNPYMIRDTVDGTTYVDDGYRYGGGGFNGPPWNTYGVSREVIVSISGLAVDWGNPTTGLCSTCHADWVAASPMSHGCSGCQTCHGHGQLWGGYDWGPAPDESTNCAAAGSTALSTMQEFTLPEVGNGPEAPPSTQPGEGDAPFDHASVDLQTETCQGCHISHGD